MIGETCVEKALLDLGASVNLLPYSIYKQFLGHTRFYRRFIKDFSKLARPLCELLVKDAKFVRDDRCQQSFQELKILLTIAPIARTPN
ncbi:hypothetical protein CK203_099383 [Vitis vinifera]|uniref:Retrovirus-related Pol polyprotein from transposon opus n=1 Tax=Vitis vinifera TaxID=29760 RepID=A0A438CHR9_VITVI|nr:hypothetical protein CK203_099383 [Vitis vinifera]